MKDVKLFIVEGEEKDYRFVNSMIDCFFKGKHEAKVIYLPAKQNIFMLYDILKKDDFETDVVEIIRDKVTGAKEILEGYSRQRFSEIYLFFDFDIQQLNYLNKEMDIMNDLFNVFNDETDNGKLYISYPMIEALYDYKVSMCQSFTNCFIEINDIKNYKFLSGNDNPNANCHLKYADWEEVLKCFYLRIKCFFEDVIIDYKYYKNFITPFSIYNKEHQLLEKNKIFVLSSLPEFLLDYFKIDFWSKYTRDRKLKYDICSK